MYDRIIEKEIIIQAYNLNIPYFLFCTLTAHANVLGMFSFLTHLFAYFLSDWTIFGKTKKMTYF